MLLRTEEKGKNIFLAVYISNELKVKLVNMGFRLDFLKSSSSESTVGTLRKSNLLEISVYCKLGAKCAMRKSQILRIVMNHFVNKEIFDQDVLEKRKEEPSDQLQINKLEIESELRKLEKKGRNKLNLES